MSLHRIGNVAVDPYDIMYFYYSGNVITIILHHNSDKLEAVFNNENDTIKAFEELLRLKQDIDKMYQDAHNFNDADL